MKLGLFDHMQKHDVPGRSYVDLYRSHLEVLECADQAGMDFYFVAEHHFDMGFSECPRPGTFLGAASQRTKKIRLGRWFMCCPCGIRSASPRKSPCSTILPKAASNAVSAPASGRSALLLTMCRGSRSVR